MRCEFCKEVRTLSKKNIIVLTLGQIVAGGIVGLAGGWICLLVLENFIWRMLIGTQEMHGFWAGFLLLLSLGITYGIVVVGASESIRFVSRQFGIQLAFKPVCSGAFLGPPAIVGLLALLNVPWEIFGAPNLLLALLLPVLKTFAYLVSLPMRWWVHFGLPVEIWYILAVPVGAILGYRLPAVEKREIRVEHT